MKPNSKRARKNQRPQAIRWRLKKRVRQINTIGGFRYITPPVMTEDMIQLEKVKTKIWNYIINWALTNPHLSQIITVAAPRQSAANQN